MLTMTFFDFYCVDVPSKYTPTVHSQEEVASCVAVPTKEIFSEVYEFFVGEYMLQIYALGNVKHSLDYIDEFAQSQVRYPIPSSHVRVNGIDGRLLSTTSVNGYARIWWFAVGEMRLIVNFYGPGTPDNELSCEVTKIIESIRRKINE